MADEKNNPFSVRMEAEDKDRLAQLIAESGKNNKEFMNVLMSAYELNQAKVNIPEIAEDIKGLEALTQQVNNYYVNIGKRIEIIQKNKDLQFTKEVEIYKSTIDSLKSENNSLGSSYEHLQIAYNNLSSDHNALNEKISQLEESLKDKTTLVAEYKEKNDTLAGLLNEYKEFKKENEDLKEKNRWFENDKLRIDTAYSNEIKNCAEWKEKYANLNNEIRELKNTHAAEISEKIQSTIEKATFEKDKALLEQEKEFNKKLQELQETSNKKILEYQNQAEELIKELQKQQHTSKEIKEATPVQAKKTSKKNEQKEDL